MKAVSAVESGVPNCILPQAQIERVRQISAEAFQKSCLTGTYQPIVVTDATTNWPAREKWTFDFFRALCGSQPVIVTERLLNPSVVKKVRLDDFLNFVEFPPSSSLSKIATDTPLYLTHFSPFSRFPKLLEDFSQPYFIENCYAGLTGQMRDWYFDNFSWVFIGPAGTLSPLHVDLFGTHAWLAQIAGRKQFTLFPPQDGPYLYDGKVDPLNPDFERYPLFAQAKAHVTILEPGEVIFIPAGWVHHVVSLDTSISVTFNYANASNLALHVSSICRDLPAWTKKLDAPAARLGLGLKWVSKGFDFPNSPEEL
jgi:histone arginine demethylase JMJD6